MYEKIKGIIMGKEHVYNTNILACADHPNIGVLTLFHTSSLIICDWLIILL